MISREEIANKIKAAFWDYAIDADEIYLIALGKKASNSFFSKEKIFIRLIERLSWYELLDMFGKEILKMSLTKSIIAKIRDPEIRSKYESIRRILQGETLPASGWSDQNRKRLKASILSDRRYSA